MQPWVMRLSLGVDDAIRCLRFSFTLAVVAGIAWTEMDEMSSLIAFLMAVLYVCLGYALGAFMARRGGTVGSLIRYVCPLLFIVLVLVGAMIVTRDMGPLLIAGYGAGAFVAASVAMWWHQRSGATRSALPGPRPTIGPRPQSTTGRVFRRQRPREILEAIGDELFHLLGLAQRRQPLERADADVAVAEPHHDCRTGGRGFIAIVFAMLARGRPLWILTGTFLFMIPFAWLISTSLTPPPPVAWRPRAARGLGGVSGSGAAVRRRLPQNGRRWLSP